MKLIALSLSLILFSFNSFAANDCAELNKCVESVSKLTGKKYIYDGKLKGELKTSSNFELTAENADNLFSTILNLNGYSRVPTAVKDTFKIIESRDIRYESLPTVNADMKTTPVFPQTEDYILLAYKFTNSKQGQTREAANSSRVFMSRYGRIIEIGDTVTLQEMASKMPQLLELIRRADRVYTKEEMAMKKEREERLEKRHEGRRHRGDGKPDAQNEKSENNKPELKK